MAYIICEPCVGTCDTACVEVCPVDCIHGPEDKTGAGAEAKADGFDEVLYLRADNEKIVEEVGSANIFMRKGNELVTPKLAGSILPGITRNSIIKLAEDHLGLNVIEGDLLLEDIFTADEVFCTGTAVVVTPVGRVTYRGETHLIHDGNMGEAATELRKTLVGIQREEIDDPYSWVYPVSS